MRLAPRALVLAMLVLVLGAPSAHGESIYVRDDLQVAVRSGPSLRHRILRMVPSGTTMEQLGVQDTWVQVALNDGLQAWVEQQYVTRDVPPSVQLPPLLRSRRQNQKRIKKLEEELARVEGVATEAKALRSRNAELEAANARLTNDAQIKQLLVGASIALVGMVLGALWRRGSGANSLAQGKRIKL